MDSQSHSGDSAMPRALQMLASERPRNVGWLASAGMLFGDWGTSRLYVLGLAFLVAGRTSFWLIMAMSFLIVWVGWAYTQVCRIYADGGGVYTAGRQRSAIVGVVGALLLFADYTVTASLSAVEAFHYFGLGEHHDKIALVEDAGEQIRIPGDGESVQEGFGLKSPALWAVISIIAIGAFNLMGPKHTAGYAIFTAAGMIVITLLIVVFALPKIDYRNLHFGHFFAQPTGDLWHGFVFIVLALSGVEAIANLTGVMRKPVGKTAGKALWVVTIEVAVFNLVLAMVMLALSSQMGREDHKEDMLAFMARQFVGPWGEWPVRILGGLLLLSATNTAVNGLMSITYVMSRDNELPGFFQKLNGFGAPWIAAIVATLVPVAVLLVAHDLTTLASMYAIGIVGAVALNTSITTFHPRLRRIARKFGMAGLALLLTAIWVTLAITKPHALVFVLVVMAVGLSLRWATQKAAARRPKQSLLRQAIREQLTPAAMAKPRLMLTTAGSDHLAREALSIAAAEESALVVCFVRNVALNYRVEAENRLTLDSDPAAQQMFADFLEAGHRLGVPILPMYDSGPNAAELIAEHAAINGVSKVLIGSSRRGRVHHIIKGSFQRKLETLLPPEIPVRVLDG